ncbi:MAG: autotransporter domain-containing protein, partial [bacterium]|nr:autotransporter domain-containing protein [bacterium]
QLRLEPEAQFIYLNSAFNKTRDIYSLVDLGSNNDVVGRSGIRLKYTLIHNKYILEPYIRCNLWSILTAANSSALYGAIHRISSTAKMTWAQLGGGITLNLSHNTGIYFFVDDLVGIKRKNENLLNGLDGGVGFRTTL